MKFIGSTLVVLFALNASAATKAASLLTCAGEGESKLCMSLPSEAPEFTDLRSDDSAKEKSLVSKTETSGGALTIENEAIRDFAIESAGGMPGVDPATLRALRTQAQLREVEVFLKSTIAANGDLRVTTTSHH